MEYKTDLCAWPGHVLISLANGDALGVGFFFRRGCSICPGNEPSCLQLKPELKALSLCQPKVSRSCQGPCSCEVVRATSFSCSVIRALPLTGFGRRCSNHPSRPPAAIKCSQGYQWQPHVFTTIFRCFLRITLLLLS